MKGSVNWQDNSGGRGSKTGGGVSGVFRFGQSRRPDGLGKESWNENMSSGRDGIAAFGRGLIRRGVFLSDILLT
jgi:hypothetical protein